MALIKNKINNSSKKPDTYRQNFVRINGWTYPLHWLQIIAWIFYLLICLICFTFIVPTLPNYQIRCIVIVVKVLIFILHFITHVIAVNTNPADDNVIDKLENRADKPTKFDRTKHSHVIENQFCYICETTVGSKSKHCSVCNKCVSDFDHHCKWLNNCVGGKNYRYFIYTVMSAMIGTMIVSINCLILTIAYFSEDSWLYDQKSTLLFFNNDSNLNQSLRVFWITVIISTLILSLIAFILLTHLLGFHLFLNCVGLSTYEFVVQQRKRRTDANNRLNKYKRNKLVSYLNHIKNVTQIFICTKKRVKPFEENPKSYLHPNDKKFITPINKSETNTELREETDRTRHNSDHEKDIEECGKQEIERKIVKSFSPKKSETLIEEHINQMNGKNKSQNSPNSEKIIESEVKTIDSNSDSNQIISRENIYENNSFVEWKANRVRPKTSCELLTKNEPIFRPLNPSFGQNGRMSRLSFINKTDFTIRSSSNGLGITSNDPNHVFDIYNNYNKLNSNNVRLNPLNRKLYKFNKISINNNLEITSND